MKNKTLKLKRINQFSQRLNQQLKVMEIADLNNAAYKNLNLSAAERAADLLSYMTIEEKAAQLMGVFIDGINDFDEEFFKDDKKVVEVFGKGVHSVHPSFYGIKKTIDIRNRIQKYLLENTRLGIPAIFVDEGQHGIMRKEATVFPQAIAISCSWNIELIEKMYSVVAYEMRSRGTHLALTPVVDVCRDPRWGRVDETYGEDPYLCAQIGTAAVKGLQGSANGTVMEKNVAATLKHFVGHGEPEGGINRGPTNFPERILREVHLKAFKTIIKNAKPKAVMPSYNEVDGVPSHSNKWLIQNVLRKELKFDGFIVSDYFAIDQLIHKHFVAEDGKDAAMQAFNAGIQYDLPLQQHYKHLPELLKEGKIKESDINEFVNQILIYKLEMGLFENRYININEAIKVSKNPESKRLALKAAQESIVLLKNDGILPLSENQYKSIAVIGPCSKGLFFGGYAGEPYEKTSLFDGIKQKVDRNIELLFAQGCQLTENADIPHLNWKNDEIVFAKKEDNLKLIEQAVNVAKSSEIIILALGENEHLCREAWAKTHLGDNNTLELFGQQQELFDKLKELNKPIIVYLMNGRPLSINKINKDANAIIEGWYTGQETGSAAADILFGDINPSGKLCITFPKSVGQLPMYYNHKPTAQYHNYLSEDINPLYHFGYGLSYTTFNIGKPSLSKTKIKANENVEINVEIKNTGSMAGAEVIQLYIRDKVSSVTRPVKELKGFQKVHLNPGEKKLIKFKITPEHLAFHNINMDFIVEPGEFEIMIGNSSMDKDLKNIVLMVE